MTNNGYYGDLVDSMKMNSASSIAREEKRIERIEKGRAQEAAAAMTNSPIFAELQKQTHLNMANIVQQERQIQELKSQNAKLESQIDMLKKSELDSKRQAKKSFIGFIISNAIALASFIVAVVALAI